MKFLWTYWEQKNRRDRFEKERDHKQTIWGEENDWREIQGGEEFHRIPEWELNRQNFVFPPLYMLSYVLMVLSWGCMFLKITWEIEDYNKLQCSCHAGSAHQCWCSCFYLHLELSYSCHLFICSYICTLGQALNLWRRNTVSYSFYILHYTNSAFWIKDAPRNFLDKQPWD